ncbi:MAG: 2,3-bisphosphoglycerate-independent phosphoglycerate mutase [Chloroflexi bacterium]|nr:2,3-bisphosphoglycerate-independent phosphoglycerate mutase [Chloroflexota bacterium]
MATPRPVVLIVMDGWGLGPDYAWNAVLHADTPVFDRLWAGWPHTQLIASGEAVGLPAGQMGNSEVGHLNLGAGFIVYQWITFLDKEIAEGRFFANAALLGAMAAAKRPGARLHLLGLIGSGGVHASGAHLAALLRLARDQAVPDVAIHAFLDGRDTPPQSALGFLQELEATAAQVGTGRVATVSGRYYAMDRDRRWERVQKAYDALVLGEGPRFASATAAIEASYAAGVTDEFMLPAIIAADGRPATTIADGDTVIFFNFRADRARELSQALLLPDFAGFARRRVPTDLHYVTLTRYEEDLPVTAAAYPPIEVREPLAAVVAAHGRRQFHTAETEKYPHVTYFFNGGREEPFPGEERLLAPSPKVATYDLQPEMSALEVTDRLVERIASGVDDFIIVNFANGDMVGHTGVFAAAVRAVETVDACVGRVVAATLARGGALLITADHGNADEMVDRVTGAPHTAHTTNPVPLILVGEGLQQACLRDGGVLADIAPTLLDLMGLPTAAAMDHASLLRRDG